MSLPYACDGRAKNTSGATRVQERAFTADSTPLPVGFRLSGAVSTRDGLLLWGRKSDSLILWPRGAAVQMFVGNRLFSGVVGVAERAPGVLEILDTIAGVGSEREISVGRMRATRSFTRVHGIESAAFASGQWRAVRPNADSSFSFIDPLIAEGELFRYRSPALPPFRSVRLASDGTIWIRTEASFTSKSEVYLVLAPSGCAAPRSVMLPLDAIVEDARGRVFITSGYVNDAPAIDTWRY